MKAKAIALFSVVVGAILWGLVHHLNSPLKIGPRTDVVFIHPGTTGRDVAGILRSEGHLRSLRLFKIFLKFFSPPGGVKAGVYRLKPDDTAWRIFKTLTDGRTLNIEVTIPEGFARWQIARRLSEAGVCDEDDFLVVTSSKPFHFVLEGLLFPDTYRFAGAMHAETVMMAMTSQFFLAWDEEFRRAEESGRVKSEDTALHAFSPNQFFRIRGEGFVLNDGRHWSGHQIVTLASLIEREARKPEERPLISAVFHNRLKRGMRLECDPTVQYALGYWKNPLWKKDLALDHPYNTYRRFGLPPGPICNPGREAIAAALSPSPVDYLYFVADETGGHRFSSTYEDHRRAVRLRQRSLRATKKS